MQLPRFIRIYVRHYRDQTDWLIWLAGHRANGSPCQYSTSHPERILEIWTVLTDRLVGRTSLRARDGSAIPALVAETPLYQLVIAETDLERLMSLAAGEPLPRRPKPQF